MYTLKNLRNMMKNHTGMLVLLVISMFVSFGVLFFGVGLYYQYSKNIEDGEIDSYAVGFSINDIITKKNFCEFVKNMPNKLMGDVSYITCFSSTQVSGIDEEIPVAFYLQYSEGKFEYSDKVFQPMIYELVIKDGSFFTQEQYSNGEKKAVVMGSGNVNQPTSAPEYTNSVTAFGQSYDVIGTINPANSSYFFYSIYVPFSSVPDDTIMNDGVYLALNNKITKSEYDDFTAYISEFFKDKITLYEPAFDLASNTSYYITVVLISVIIAILSALNISILYNYIIISRTRQLTIMRICGGLTSNLSISTANEIILIMLPVSIISALCYDKFILTVLSAKFPLMKAAYNPYVYAEIILIYSAISYLLNLFLLHHNLGKKIKEGLK